MSGNDDGDRKTLLDVLESMRTHPFIEKLVEWDRQYHWTIYVEAFLLGFAIAIFLVYYRPDLFPEISIGESVDNVFRPVIENDIGEVLENGTGSTVG